PVVVFMYVRRPRCSRCYPYLSGVRVCTWEGLPGGLHYCRRTSDRPGTLSHAGCCFLLALRLSSGGQSVCAAYTTRLQLWPLAERAIPAPLPVSGAQPGRAGSDRL